MRVGREDGYEHKFRHHRKRFVIIVGASGVPEDRFTKPCRRLPVHYPTWTPPPPDYDLAVVIVNWNAAADTLACVERLATWRTFQTRVWVVDNASNAADGEHLRRALPACARTCTLLENDTNRGFAGGSNVGIAAALAKSDSPILLLNNDATLSEDDAGRMLATLAEQPRTFMVGPLLYHGGKLLNSGHRDPARHHHTSITIPASTPVAAVDYISGSVALIRASVLRQVGLLDEDYFFNTEVADLCFRARAAGYLTVVDTRARAQHNLDRSSSLRSTLYTYYIIRNRFVFIAKRYRAAAWALTGFWAVYSLLLSAKLRWSGERGPARAVYLGMVDGVTRRWGGQNARILAACGQAGS